MVSVGKVNYRCGGGKTYVAITHIKETQDNTITPVRYIIACPTRILALQIKAVCKEKNIKNIHLIMSPDPKNPMEDEMNNLYNSLSISERFAKIEGKASQSEESSVLMISHKSLIQNKCFEHDESKKKDYILVIDESLGSLDTFYEMQIPYGVNMVLSKCIEIDTKVNQSYRMKLTKGANGKYVAEQFLKLAKDKTVKEQIDIISRMLNDWVCFVDADSWDRIVINKQIETGSLREQEKKNKIFALLMPSPNFLYGFKHILAMMANFDMDLVYSWFSEHYEKHTGKPGVQFINDPSIIIPESKATHTNGHLVTIKYAVEGFNWSKNKRDTAFIEYNGQKISILQAINKIIVDDIGESNVNEILTSYNKDTKPEDKIEGAVELPVISHGLNTYSDFSKIFAGFALNKKAKHKSMLMDIGFTAEFIDQSFMGQIVYQCVCRTSIRNGESIIEVIIYVVDKKTATFLQSLFVGSTVEFIKNGLTKEDIIQSEEQQDKNKNKSEKKLATKTKQSDYNSERRKTDPARKAKDSEYRAARQKRLREQAKAA
jgi:hypothetical protein